MSYLDDIIAERENMISRGEIPAPLPYAPTKHFGLAAAQDEFTRKVAEQEAWDSFVGKKTPATDANGEPIDQTSNGNTTWGGFRGFGTGAAGVVQGQAQLGNLMGIGDGATVNALEGFMQRNARKKEYTIGDMLPFASDYWTNGEGAAYDIGNMLGSSAVLGAETLAAMTTGGAALGALGVGGRAAAAAAARVTQAGGSAAAARAAAKAAASAAREGFMTDAVTNGMARAANKIGMTKLANVLQGPMGKLYAANILKTPLEASSEAGSAGAEALANGANLDDAQRQALIVGGLQMPLLALSNTIESAGLGGLFMKEAEKATGQKVGKEGLLAILGSVTREGMQNAWEEGMQQSTHEYAAGKQSLLGVVNPLQWSDEAAQQAAVGAVGGLAIGGGNAALRGYATRDTANPVAENTPATTPAPTPAQLAREYLDEQGQQDGKFTPEQQAAMWEAAENGDDQTVIDLATQMGWQNPEAQQGQEQQAQPAPVTPTSTPEEQIQTATNAVNAATAAVVNGGQATDNGEQGTSAPVEQTVQQQTIQPTVRSVSGGNITYPTSGTPTFGVAENPVDQTGVKAWADSLKRAMGSKLAKGSKTKKYLNADGTVNTRILRASPALRRFFYENQNALGNLQAALNGNKQAMDWMKGLTPTRQAALLDALENGIENWQTTDADIQAFAKYDHDVALRNIKRSLYDKAKKLRKNEARALYALLKKENNEQGLIAAAEKYGVNIPEVLQKKGESTTVETVPMSNANANVGSTTNAQNSNTSSAISAAIDNILSNGSKPTESTTSTPVEQADNSAANTTPAATPNTLPTLKFAGATIHPKLSKDGKMIGFRLPNGAMLSKQELTDFKAAGFTYNDGLKANIANDNEAVRRFLTKYAAEQPDDNQGTNGGNNNATGTNGTRKNGTGEGNKNPVQGQQSKEPVQTKTDDNKGEGENGEVEVVSNATANTTSSSKEQKADNNNITAIPHDADAATVQKLQKENTKIIMDKVNSIDKEYDDGKLTADEARKAITNFFQKYSQSRAAHKVYENGVDKKVSAIKKNITKKEEQKNREAERVKQEAAAKVKQEAEEKRKKAYNDDFNEAMAETDGILKQHQNEEMTLEAAKDLIDRIAEGLEDKLAARGDKLRVKDKAQLRDRKLAQLERQQKEIDKKIFENAAIQAMAGSDKQLNEDGLKVFVWVKKELSNDVKKRFKEKSIDAAAAMVALRAQTWTELFNKYCGTHYTPLEYAQRYPIYLYDNNIPEQTESVRGLTTRSSNPLSGGKIEFAGNAKTLEIFHELGHVFFADFIHIAETPDAPQKLKDDLRTLREWIGEVDPANKDLETPYFQSKQDVEEMSPEERFAQAMVKHVAAADTPIKWLNDMFKEFAQKLLETIQYWNLKLKEALAKPEATDVTRRYARAYTFDFKIPADVKRIINEMIYYDGGENKVVTYDTQLEDLEKIGKEIDSLFSEEKAPSPKVLNNLKARIAAAGRWANEYTNEQKEVLKAAADFMSKKLEVASMEQDSRLAFNKKETGDTSESTLVNAASGLLKDDPTQLETLDDDVLNLLSDALEEQQRDDVADMGREELVQAVLSDYAASEKLDDDFGEFRDGLKDDGIEEAAIKAVEKYAGLILKTLKKYQPLYKKQKELEEAEKALDKAKSALKLKALAEQNKGGASSKAFKIPKELRGGKLGEAMYQAAWHGSPHIIEGNLTTERIGSGSGATAHGWGLYFAKSREVSQYNYRERLARINGEESQGELLKVEIPENDVLLDENKTYKEQPFRVKKALKTIAEKLGDKNEVLGYAINKNLTGDDLYRELGKLLLYTTNKHRYGNIRKNDIMASKMLNDYGIKGIRYKDSVDGECFVIFDDDAIAIKQRYDAALRKHQEELQRSRAEVISKIKSMFAGSKFEEQENGDLLVTTKGGNKILYKITDRILLNGAEAQEARKAHGIADDAEVFTEGRYRTVYEGDIDAMVEVGLDSRKNTEAHETTHAVINLALGEEGSKPLFERAEKLIKEYGLKADKEEVACDAVRDFITARENGFITTFTANERAELNKTFWGRMMLRANEMGAKAKVLSDKNEAELSKTVWGKLLLTKLKIQRNLAKLMRNVYDFYKKFKATRDANETFHNLARKIELGEVWNEKGEKNSVKNEKYSARPRKEKDFTISSINLKYKKELEEAFERNANAGEITAIQNRHQDELAKYLKEKGEKQKEKAKLRAAELRELRKKLKAHEIDSFEMAGGKVTLGKDGKEKFESIQDPNELPTFVYKNNQHNDAVYKNASSLQRLNASIKRPEEKGTAQTVKDYIKNARDKFYKQWVDKYDALGILDKAIAKKGGKPADESMTILNRMQFAANNAMGAARALIEGDENSLKPLADKWGFKKTASLKMVLQKLETDHKSGKYADYIKNSSLGGGALIQDYLNAFESYLTANTLLESARNHKLDYDREVAEWKKKGSRGEKPKETPYKFPNNMVEEDIKEIIRNAPPVFKTYQKMFKNVTDNILDILLKSGLITLDRYDTLKDRYKYYCPLFRDFSDTAAVDDFISQINAGRGMANVSDPLKSRSSEGSYRDVMSPLTSAVKSISAICAKAERNRVGQYAVRQAKKHHLNDYIREIKGNAGDAKNCVFTVMINGEKHAYQTTPELYPAITAAVEPLCKLDFALLTKPAQILRYGSTMSPSFIIRNFLRDTIFATVSSKNGFIPIYDSIRGGWAYTHNKTLRGEYEAAGVASSNYYSDSEAVMQSLNEMAGGKTWQEKTPMDIIKATLKYPIGKLEWLSDVIENSTRMGEFMRARAKGKNIEQAGHDAVEVSLNFNRSGATGQQVNKMVPFFNACIQGGDKLYRLGKADFKGTMFKIAKYIVLPSVILWALNHDEDWYKDLDPNIKMTNWIIGGLRIPKPQEAGILFGSGVEALLDTANGQDPQAMKEWRHNVLEALTPGFLPTVILPIIEWIANYSFFRGKPTVNQGMQRLPAEMQYGPYTSESAKFIGQTAKDIGLGGVSPAKIDNFFRGYTGTMGMFLFQSPDWFAAEKQNLPEKKLIEMPIARDFIINDMNFNRTMNDFYELKDAASKQHAGYGKKGKPSPEVAGVNVATQTIQKLQKEAREITASNKYNSAQKRAMIDKLKAKQDKIARAAIKKYGSKFDI